MDLTDEAFDNEICNWLKGDNMEQICKLCLSFKMCNLNVVPSIQASKYISPLSFSSYTLTLHHEVGLEVLIILVDVLLAVRPQLRESSLPRLLNILGVVVYLGAVAVHLPGDEDHEDEETPDVADEGDRELDGELQPTPLKAEYHCQDKRGGDDWEHPDSGPEQELFHPVLLAQEEPSQREQRYSTIGKS